MARRAEEEDAVAESRSLLRGDAAAQASRARFGHKDELLPWYHPTRPLFQWTGLLVISFFTFGTSVAYDSVGALGPLIRSELKVSPNALAELYSVYHLPNLVLVFIGGLMSDRMGVQRASLLFNTLVCAGVVMVALSRSLTGMIIGRLVFGMGSETLSVVQLGALSRWFSRSPTPPSLGLACAIALTVSRLGTVVAFDVLPLVGDTSLGLRGAFWLVVIFCGMCFGLNLVFVLMDAHLDPYLRRADFVAVRSDSKDDAEVKPLPPEPLPREELSLTAVIATLRRFSPAYWLIVVICICMYSALVTFSDFSADFFHEGWGMTGEHASRLQSVSVLISLFLTPVAGHFADRVGKRGHFMLVGAALLVPAHLIFAQRLLPPVLGTILQGLASAIALSAMWPSIALILPERQVNTAVGLMTAIQNTALFTVPLVVGELRVATGSYAVAPYFYMALDCLGIYCALRLIRYRDADGENILNFSAAEIRDYDARHVDALDPEDADCEDAPPILTADD